MCSHHFSLADGFHTGIQKTIQLFQPIVRIGWKLEMALQAIFHCYEKYWNHPSLFYWVISRRELLTNESQTSYTLHRHSQTAGRIREAFSSFPLGGNWKGEWEFSRVFIRFPNSTELGSSLARQRKFHYLILRVYLGTDSGTLQHWVTLYFHLPCPWLDVTQVWCVSGTLNKFNLLCSSNTFFSIFYLNKLFFLKLFLGTKYFVQFSSWLLDE